MTYSTQGLAMVAGWNVRRARRSIPSSRPTPTDDRPAPHAGGADRHRGAAVRRAWAAWRVVARDRSRRRAAEQQRDPVPLRFERRAGRGDLRAPLGGRERATPATARRIGGGRRNRHPIVDRSLLRSVGRADRIGQLVRRASSPGSAPTASTRYSATRRTGSWHRHTTASPRRCGTVRLPACPADCSGTDGRSRSTWA